MRSVRAANVGGRGQRRVERRPASRPRPAARRRASRRAITARSASASRWWPPRQSRGSRSGNSSDGRAEELEVLRPPMGVGHRARRRRARDAGAAASSSATTSARAAPVEPGDAQADLSLGEALRLRKAATRRATCLPRLEPRRASSRAVPRTVAAHPRGCRGPRAPARRSSGGWAPRPARTARARPSSPAAQRQRERHHAAVGVAGDDRRRSDGGHQGFEQGGGIGSVGLGVHRQRRRVAVARQIRRDDAVALDRRSPTRDQAFRYPASRGSAARWTRSRSPRSHRPIGDRSDGDGYRAPLAR